jgi:hypothetical protein
VLQLSLFIKCFADSNKSTTALTAPSLKTTDDAAFLFALLADL